MPELYANTHGMAVAGASGTAAADTTIGTITLPAGGPWIVHGFWGQVVSATATAAESIGGHIRLEVASGDLTPNPAPSKFPCFESGSSLGATIDRGQCPLNIFPVQYEAAGKAVINMIYHQAIACTVAPQVVMGLIFGKSVAEVKPFPFCDVSRAAVAAAADTAVGTITLAEKATRIVGVCGILSQDGVLVTAEELTGFFRLSSDDIKMPPMQLPFNNVYGAGEGALIQGGNQGNINFIPVDIPVPGGARIDSFVDLNTAVTNAADVEIFIAFE